MISKNPQKNVLEHLRLSVQTLLSHPLILYPFCVIAFVQLLVLEILYLSPRAPLSFFFAPIIKTLYGEVYVHYPFNFIVLLKLFPYLQIVIYIFFSSFLIGVAIDIISAVNNERRISFKQAFSHVLPQYVHTTVAAVIIYLTYYGASSFRNLIINRALQVRSESGKFYLLKKLVLDGAPFINLLIGVLVTALFAFVFTIIVLEKKKVFKAIILNFRQLWSSGVFIFMIVLLPTLLYLPVLLLWNHLKGVGETWPAFEVWLIVLSVIVLTLIDSIVYTAITSYYLLKQEK